MRDQVNVDIQYPPLKKSMDILIQFIYSFIYFGGGESFGAEPCGSPGRSISCLTRTCCYLVITRKARLLLLFFFYFL